MRQNCTCSQIYFSKLPRIRGSNTLWWCQTRKRPMLKMVEAATATHVHVKRPFSTTPCVSFSTGNLRIKTTGTKTVNSCKAWKLVVAAAEASALSSSSSSGSFNRTSGGQLFRGNEICGNKKERSTSKKRVFFLDVNPLCYAGSTPSLHSFGYWISLFFSQVSLSDPVIAVNSLSIFSFCYINFHEVNAVGLFDFVC